MKNVIKNKTVGILGCGNMGEAILKAMISRSIFTPNRVKIYDNRPARCKYLEKVYKVKATGSFLELAKNSDILIIAVKPQDIEKAADLNGYKIKGKFIISIAAGITIKTLRKMFGMDVSIARTMPNMAALVETSITVISYSRDTKIDERLIARMIFSSLGSVIELKERHINAATAVSGSGPGYLFYFADKFLKAACELGLNKTVAKILVAKTIFGSSKLLVTSNLDPKDLVLKVASKGGTTQAALEIFEKSKIEGVVKKALKAANYRAKQLSR